jgi:hypothetical protein
MRRRNVGLADGNGPLVAAFRQGLKETGYIEAKLRSRLTK